MSAEFRLSESQLNAAVRGRRFTEQVIEIARLLMVKGKAVSELMQEYDITRGRLYHIRQQVWSAFLECAMYPSHWETVSITASPELIAEFQQRAEQERSEWLAQMTETDAPKAPKKAKPAAKKAAKKTKRAG